MVCYRKVIVNFRILFVENDKCINMKTYHLKQLYLNIFRTQSKAKAINSLKSLHNIVEIRNVIDCIKGVYSSISNDIEGVFYPKTLDELCKKTSTFFRPDSTLYGIMKQNLFYMNMRGRLRKD